MTEVTKLYIPNETSANSVGANSIYETISELIEDDPYLSSHKEGGIAACL